MNEANQSKASLEIPAKRKRGRPRKVENLKRQYTKLPVPPGFKRVNGHQPHQVNPAGFVGVNGNQPGVEGLNGNQPPQVNPTGVEGVNRNKRRRAIRNEDANKLMVRLEVIGIVEATFDAGYMIAVKVGNSDTIFRGAVFAPGHTAPVTSENDVAPNAPMIRRNDSHFPTENPTRVRRRKSRPRERNEQGNGSAPVSQLDIFAPRIAKPVPLKRTYVPDPSVSLVGSRGTVVPVELKPVNLSNGLQPANLLPPSASQGTYVLAFKGKHVQSVEPLAAVYPPNGSTPADQVLTLTSSHSGSSSQGTPKSVGNDNNPFNQGTSKLKKGGEVKSLNSTERDDGKSNTSFRSSAEYSGAAWSQGLADLNEPLNIQPLQTVGADLHTKSAFVSNTLDFTRTGRMTELLQEVHQNLPSGSKEGPTS